MIGGRIKVRRARHKTRPHALYNWVVEDSTGGKVFTRVFVFSFFAAAIREADRLARTGQIKPLALMAVERRYEVTE